jgi:hypothetical protein
MQAPVRMAWHGLGNRTGKSGPFIGILSGYSWIRTII